MQAIQAETGEATAVMEVSTREVVEGSAVAEQAGEAWPRSNAVSQTLAALIHSIFEEARRQASASRGVSEAMGEISEITEQTAAGASEGAEAVGRLARLADGLRESVGAFRLPGGPGRAGRAEPSRRRAGRCGSAGRAADAWRSFSEPRTQRSGVSGRGQPLTPLRCVRRLGPNEEAAMTRTLDPIEPELLEIFLQEAADHLQTIRSHLPALRSGAADAVQAVRRAAHTLKGSAAVVGFGAVTRLAHRMEDLLDRLSEGFSSTPDITDLLKASTDCLEDLTAGQEDTAALQKLYAVYDRLLGDAEPASASADGPATPVGTRTAESFVRVPLRRLDEVVRLVGELMIARTAFEQRLDASSQPNGDADDLMGRQARLLSEIHDRLMHIRLVPFGDVAPRLHRTIRRVAERSGKPVELALEGESVEVDKAVLEEMAEPLMHLLRNAVDHGIEPAKLRRERGKPECGRVTVRAAHEGDQVVLRLGDDGGGVDGEAVRRRAVERGLASADAAARMTETELFALVFEPGFSTAPAVSETSGRGVGLDVVRSCVERLKGSVSLASRRGEGTTFVVRLPMTVAVMRPLLVRARPDLRAAVGVGRPCRPPRSGSGAKNYTDRR